MRDAHAVDRLQLPHIVNRPRIVRRAALAGKARSQIDPDRPSVDIDRSRSPIVRIRNAVVVPIERTRPRDNPASRKPIEIAPRNLRHKYLPRRRQPLRRNAQSVIRRQTARGVRRIVADRGRGNLHPQSRRELVFRIRESNFAMRIRSVDGNQRLGSVPSVIKFNLTVTPL